MCFLLNTVCVMYLSEFDDFFPVSVSLGVELLVGFLQLGRLGLTLSQSFGRLLQFPGLLLQSQHFCLGGSVYILLYTENGKMVVVRNCNSVVKREEGRREEKWRKEERKRGRKRGSERGREMGRMKGVGWEGRKREGKRGEDREKRERFSYRSASVISKLRLLASPVLPTSADKEGERERTHYKRECTNINVHTRVECSTTVGTPDFSLSASSIVVSSSICS